MLLKPGSKPLAPDCEELRLSLLVNPLPPIWMLDAAKARRLHIKLSLQTVANWAPPLAGLPVSAIELPGEGDRPAMRCYRRDGSETTTCLLWLHGGGWVLGNLDTTDATARTACDATGWEVVAVDYRCAPAARFPAAIDDSLAAVDWALSHYDKVIVGGDSAGGNLAAVVARERGDHPALVGQVLVYPVTDPSMSSESYREFVDGPFLTQRDMEWFYDEYVPERGDRTSPLVDLVTDIDARVLAPVPAVVFTVGHDPLRDEGIAYAGALEDNGADVTWIHAPELYHGAFSNSGYLPSAAVRVQEVWATAYRTLS